MNDDAANDDNNVTDEQRMQQLRFRLKEHAAEVKRAGDARDVVAFTRATKDAMVTVHEMAALMRKLER